MANNMDPDETAPRGAVWSGFIMFDCLLGLILYIQVNNFSVMPGQVFLG